MDGRGGCCIAKYEGGGGSYYCNMSKLDRIMLRYRPIAPKPSVSGSGSSSPPQKCEVSVKTSRGKRKYVKAESNNSTNISSSNKKCTSAGSRKRKTPSSSPDKTSSGGGSVSGGEKVVALPLLPETPERKDSNSPATDVVEKAGKKGRIWFSFGNQECNNYYDSHGTFMHVPYHVRTSWVRVESVSESWVGGTNEGRLMNLESEKCPGFISDGLNRVTWVSRGYRELIGEWEGEDVVVWLAVKDGVRLPVDSSTAAFTCQVRVVTGGKEKRPLVLPCDVWRMDCGGFAWRLDAEAALSLGR